MAHRRAHARHVYAKPGVHNRAEAVERGPRPQPAGTVIAQAMMPDPNHVIRVMPDHQAEREA
jgi:hypothetical protein